MDLKADPSLNSVSIQSALFKYSIVYMISISSMSFVCQVDWFSFCALTVFLTANLEFHQVLNSTSEFNLMCCPRFSPYRHRLHTLQIKIKLQKNNKKNGAKYKLVSRNNFLSPKLTRAIRFIEEVTVFFKNDLFMPPTNERYSQVFFEYFCSRIYRGSVIPLKLMPRLLVIRIQF